MSNKIFGRLTKISTNPNALRTNEIVGHFQSPPTVGKTFMMFSESLTPGMDNRRVTTSLVVSISEESGTTIFKTENSTYKLEILKGTIAGKQSDRG